MTRACSFCHADQEDCYSMVAGPAAAICYQCAIRCMEIMRDYTAGELEYQSWFAVAAIREGTNHG